MKKLFALLTLIFIATAQPTSAQSIDDDIMRMLRASGMESSMRQTAEMMIAQFRQMPGLSIPPAVWESIMSRIDTNELMREMVPIYRRHFTQAEIRELIRFYESPVGRKMAQVMPQITQETMEVGQRWGEKMSGQIMLEMMQQQGR